LTIIAHTNERDANRKLDIGDKPHEGHQPHVHFDDGTSMNQDGRTWSHNGKQGTGVIKWV